MPPAAVEDLGLDHAGRGGVPRTEAELEGGILADCNIRFEAKYRLAVVAQLERLHEISRDIVPRHLVHLQTRIVRVAYQQFGIYRSIRACTVGQVQFHLTEPLKGERLVLASGR